MEDITQSFINQFETLKKHFKDFQVIQLYEEVDSDDIFNKYTIFLSNFLAFMGVTSKYVLDHKVNASNAFLSVFHLYDCFGPSKIIVPDVFDIYYELYMHTMSLNEVEAYFD